MAPVSNVTFGKCGELSIGVQWSEYAIDSDRGVDGGPQRGVSGLGCSDRDKGKRRFVEWLWMEWWLWVEMLVEIEDRNTTYTLEWVV